MRIGIDDTDSPEGMCTTYLGAVLARRFEAVGIAVREARLIRLNPNVPYKTRGNAAICLEAVGDAVSAFALATETVAALAAMDHPATHPGVVVAESAIPPSFYHQAVTGFCELADAVALLEQAGARYRGFKDGRGLIGATAAVAADLPDATYELLVYRQEAHWGKTRQVDRRSVFAADEATYPHTWDTVDRENELVVCVPHTPDPVLFGIRGERPGWVSFAREQVISERPGLEQVFVTNQNTDAHLIDGNPAKLVDGCSYRLHGTVSRPPRTGKGGHVSVAIRSAGDHEVRCMAYEPTRGFRERVRSLIPGDRVTVCGSYKGGSINLEKFYLHSAEARIIQRPPVCERCGKRMTSAGTGKGFKCRQCGGRAKVPEVTSEERAISRGWYEVPPSARRHLARPLCRGIPVPAFDA